MLEIYQFPCLNDNYGFILNLKGENKTVCIDTPDADAIIAKAHELGLKIDEVWNTHWHADHAGGNQKIHDEFGAICIGPQEVAKHGFLLHQELNAGADFNLGGLKVEIIGLGGHTLGQIGYFFPSEKKVFVGDALFVLGCGRLFEGDAKMAHQSLERLCNLPPETMFYCAHEYSQANARFCESLGLSNEKLKARIAQIDALRAEKIPTVPANLGLEMACSPYLLADFENLKIELGLEGKSREEVFAFVRKAKDNF